jgi:hypothetical protein
MLLQQQQQQQQQAPIQGLYTFAVRLVTGLRVHADADFQYTCWHCLADAPAEGLNAVQSEASKEAAAAQANAQAKI